MKKNVKTLSEINSGLQSPVFVDLKIENDFAYLYADGADGQKWYRIASANANVPDWQGSTEDTPTYREVVEWGSWICNESTGIHCN